MSNVYVKLIVAISLLAFSAFGGYKWSDNNWQTKWANAETEASKAQADLIDAAIKKHNDRATELEKLNNELKQQFADLEVSRRNADIAADSLSKSFSDSLRQSGSCDNATATTRERAADATDRTVQAYLFESIVREAKEYAGIAGQAITRGEACQVLYEKLRGN